MDVEGPREQSLLESMKPPMACSLPAPPRRFRHVPLQGPLAKSSRFLAPEKWMITEMRALLRW